MAISSVVQGLSSPTAAAQTLGSTSTQQTLSADSGVKAQTEQALKASEKGASLQSDTQDSNQGGAASEGRGALVDIKI